MEIGLGGRLDLFPYLGNGGQGDREEVAMSPATDGALVVGN